MPEGYKPLESRVQGIIDMLPPRNKKEVCIFVGMINFIKNHIPRRAALMEPITRLTKKTFLSSGSQSNKQHLTS